MRIPALLSIVSSFLLAASLVACSDPAGGPGDDDDDVPGDAGVDAPPCAGPRDEQPGNGRDDDCDGLIDEATVCASGSAAYRTLGEAVTAAPDGGAIEVCAGTYVERFVVSGKRLGIRGAGTDATIIDGAAAGTTITVGAGGELTLADLTVRRGASTGGGGNLVCGGAALTLQHVAVADGRGETGGGGLWASGCRLSVDGSRFTDNEGALGYGGAIALTDSEGGISGSMFSGNHAERGGAIWMSGGDVAVRRNELRDNRAQNQGGAIWIGADAAIEENVIASNHSGWTGGGLYVREHAPRIHKNTIDGNDAVEEGGGIYFHWSSATVSENHITNNQAMDDGGGMRVFTCRATFERNLISGNRSGSDGGGFKISHQQSLFVDNEIVDNTAMWAGGGVEMDNDASTIRGGVIARNHAGVGGGVHIMLWPWEGGALEDVRITDNTAVRAAGLSIHDNYQPVTLRRVTIANNVASGDGGGIWTRRTRLVVSNATISNNRARDQGGAVWIGPLDEPWTSMEYAPPPLDPPVTFAFSVLHGNSSREGAGFHVSVPNVTVTSSILEDNAGPAVTAAVGVRPTWRYNDTWPSSFQGMADPSGSDGNMTARAGFANAVGGDFHLGAGSACIDAGDPAMHDHDTSRADMGVYGGPDAP